MSSPQNHIVNLHSARPDDSLTPLRRRACDLCRQRKSRCDGGDTCTVCLKANSPCQYLTASKKRRPRSRFSGQRNTPLRPAPPKISPEGLDQSEQQHGQNHSGHNPEGPSNELNNPYKSQDLTDILLGDILSSGREVVGAEGCNSRATFSTTSSASAPLEVPEYTDFLDDVSLKPNEHEVLHQSVLDSFIGPSGDPTERHPDNKATTNTTPAREMKDAPFAISPAAFVPYLELFFLRLSPIFPVLDQESLRAKCQTSIGNVEQLTFSDYALVTALSAAVVVQLNVPDRTSILEAFSGSSPPGNTQFEAHPAEFFVSQCLMAREHDGFIESPDQNTVMTSFFLFAYFGNIDRQRSAWYYLREAIGFVLLLGLDDEDAYSGMNETVSQRWRRIFWLLFVTERAFALQHRSGVMLKPSPVLPSIFESEDPKLIYGFVHLVSIYKKIDETFITAWKTKMLPENITPGLSYSPQNLKAWLSEFQRNFDHPRALAMLEMDETQKLDIMVTQSWVRMLVWQLGLRRGLLKNEPSTSSKVDLAEIDITSSMYPLRISQELLKAVSSAERGPLEAHGIGMEQKIFDVACALSDVLRCSSDWGSETNALGNGFLHCFMGLLANFRNQESQYFRPLMDRASEGLDTAASLPQFVSLAEETEDVSQVDALPPE